ncbi:MAG: dephospho-CoA kinase [Alphaproteobacteria bacterium]
MARRLGVLGLTGSIGMGKSTAAAMLSRLGVPVFSADACVHRLLSPGGAAVAAVAKAFPGTKKARGISRAALGRAVFGDDAALQKLEEILHPMVRAREHAFIRRQAIAGRSLCVLEIPLLFETGADAMCDAVIVVTAPSFVQESRVLARPGMTRKRLASVRARQMGESEKISRADFCVATGLGRRHTWRALRAIVAKFLRKRNGRSDA